VLAQAGCRSTERATAGLRCPVETFGFGPLADWSARDLIGRRGRYEFSIAQHGSHVARVRLRVPGRHNVLNALAAAALAWQHGVAPEQIARTLGEFRGIARRLEVLGCWRGVVMIDDYAHHPTEVSASLAAVRRMYPGRRVWCVFQPHQVSRTERLLDELAASLQNADNVVVAEIFRAREPGPTSGEVTAGDLAQAVRSLVGRAADIHSDDGIVRLLETELRPRDVLVTMGAGDIRKVCHGLIDRLREDRAAG
jgi:UDP-N-acetylmuramate--alanine ligase